MLGCYVLCSADIGFTIEFHNRMVQGTSCMSRAMRVTGALTVGLAAVAA